MRLHLLRLAVLSGSLLLASSAVAAPIGILNTDGEVSVGLSMIDFLGGVAAGTGSFDISATTQEGAFTAVAGTTGTILDLDSASQPVGSPFVLDDFMTFSVPGLSFRLEFIEPGVFTSDACMDAAAGGQTCTPFVGSPFNLVNTTAGSSTVSLVVRGTAFDATGGAPFIGVFTSQFSNLSFQDMLTTLADEDSVNASYSANFNVVPEDLNVIPEPGTGSMMLGGVLMLVAFTFLARNRRRRETCRE